MRTRPKMTNVTVKVHPNNAGWIKHSTRFLGQGWDTLLFAPVGGTVKLEAVPRVGWMFDYWEGNVDRTDTFVVHLEVQKGAWVNCVFDSLP